MNPLSRIHGLGFEPSNQWHNTAKIDESNGTFRLGVYLVVSSMTAKWVFWHKP
jgi:hypothetical protein